jgi:hypothetical protein
LWGGQIAGCTQGPGFDPQQKAKQKIHCKNRLKDDGGINHTQQFTNMTFFCFFFETRSHHAARTASASQVLGLQPAPTCPAQTWHF